MDSTKSADDRLERAREKQRLMRERGELVQLDPLEKARRNPTSLRAALDAKCWDCNGRSRAAVRDCPATRCPLHALRPWQRRDDDTDESA